MTLNYDPTATLSDNVIVNEIHLITGDAAIFPVEHPFYIKDLSIVGTLDNDDLVDFQSMIDFTYSPLFTSRAATAGIDVYSYIVMLKPELYKSIRLTYRAVGGDVDATLLRQLIDLGEFDRSKPQNWLDIDGDSVGHRLADVDPKVNSRGLLETIGHKVGAITRDLADAPDVPARMTDIDLLTRVEDLESGVAKIKPLLEKATNDVAGSMYLSKEIENSVGVEEYKGVTSLGLARETESVTADISANLPSLSRISSPIIVFPYDTTKDYTLAYEFSVTGYNTGQFFVGKHEFTDWELYADPELTVLVDRSYDDTENLLTYVPTGIAESRDYYLRVRFGSDNHVSDWSKTRHFVTAFDLRTISKPTITFPSNLDTDISVQPVIHTSAFAMAVGTVTHTSSDYVISNDLLGKDIVYKAMGVSDLESHLIAKDMIPGSRLFVKARHSGSGISSKWSDPVEYTTTLNADVPLTLHETSRSNDDNLLTSDVMSNGNIVMAGYTTNPGDGNRSGFISLYDSDLNLLNSKSYGPYAAFQINDIVIVDDVIYAVGTVRETTADAGVVLQINSSLDIVNSVVSTIANPVTYTGIGYHDNKLIICGTDLGSTSYPILVAYDLTLKLLYSKRITGLSKGTSSKLRISDVGDIYTVGYLQSPLSGTDGWIVKTDMSFAPQHVVVLSNGLPHADKLNDVIVDNVGDITVIGTLSKASGLERGCVFRLSPDLTIQSQLSFTGANGESFEGVEYKDDILYITGTTNSFGDGATGDGLIVKMDESINIADTKAIGYVGSDSLDTVLLANYYIYMGGSLNGKLSAVRIDEGFNADQLVAAPYPELVITDPALSRSIEALTVTEKSFDMLSNHITDTAFNISTEVITLT